jgi:hypothetical protein
VCRLDSCGSGYGLMADSREHGNEPSDSIKVEEFCDQLKYSHRLKKGLCCMGLSLSKILNEGASFHCLLLQDYDDLFRPC